MKKNVSHGIDLANEAHHLAESSFKQWTFQRTQNFMSSYNICGYKQQDKNNYISNIRVWYLPKHFNIEFYDRHLAFVWKKEISVLSSNTGLT